MPHGLPVTVTGLVVTSTNVTNGTTGVMFSTALPFEALSASSVVVYGIPAPYTAVNGAFLLAQCSFVLSGGSFSTLNVPYAYGSLLNVATTGTIAYCAQAVTTTLNGKVYPPTVTGPGIIGAPVIKVSVKATRDIPSLFAVLGLFVTAVDIANGTSEILVQGSYSQPPYFTGDTVLVSSVPAPYAGFDGDWEVLGVTQVGNQWYITIGYAYGVLLSVANPGGYINVAADPLLVICGTAPKVTGARAFAAPREGSSAITISGGAVSQGPHASTTGNVGVVFVRTQANLTSDTNYRRWATVAYNRQIFFTNELNPILFTDGATVFRYSNQQPSARYIDIFFDHLVIAWPSWNGSASPTRVQWSDLYRINQWIPSPKNEADFYDIEEWCRTDFPLYGCTGLGRIGNTLWVYTPTAIVSLRYQGRIKSPVFNQSLTGAGGSSGGPIMVTGDKVFKDIGNSLMWGLVVYKDMHYFWDGVEQDFYRFNGEQVESIGIKIKGYFLSNVNSVWPLFQATWGYARPGRQEIVWVFVSNKQTSLVFDQAIVFNWKTSRWYTQSVENVHCFNGPCLSAGRADDLTGNADSLSGTADQLLVASTLSPPLWGAGNGTVLRESTDADPDSTLLSQDTPTLVTKDFGYEDLEHIKEASSIVLHAMDRYSSGVNVSLSVRDNLDDPVTFPTTGLYKYSPEEKRYGLPRNAGRLLRYKFQPSTKNGPVRDFVWGGFVDNVKRKVTDA